MVAGADAEASCGAESADNEPWVVINYIVQRGDSPWRIAAALTGHGRNWLWMWAFGGLSEKLRPGDHLDFRIMPLPGRSLLLPDHRDR